MPQYKHLQIKRQWEEYNPSYIIKSKYTSTLKYNPSYIIIRHPSSLKSLYSITWWEYLTSSKEWANPNTESQTKWYVTMKMNSNIVMPQGKLVSLRSLTKKRVMPQCRAISKMLKKQYSSHKCLHHDPITLKINQHW